MLKRLERDGYVLQIPQPKDRPYLYMPNPAKMHHTSSKLSHFLGLADLYLQFGRPSVFNIEPQISDEYRPDAYMVKDDHHAILEYQRSIISQKRMQDKVDRFVSAYAAGKHKCRVMVIVSNFKYKVTAPTGFVIRNIEKAPSA